MVFHGKGGNLIRDADLIPRMRKGGCYQVLFGIEVGTDEDLARIHKTKEPYTEQLQFIGHQFAAAGSVDHEITPASGTDESPFIAEGAGPLATPAGHGLVVVFDSRKADVSVHGEEIVSGHGKLIQIGKERAGRSEHDLGIVPVRKSLDVFVSTT